MALKIGTDPEPKRTSYDFIDFRCGSPWLDPDPPPYEPPTCNESPQLIDACASGDVCRLKTLLPTINKECDLSVIDESRLPITQMFITAVAQKRHVILEFLLDSFSQWYARSPGVLRTAFENPDLSVFKLLHSRYPFIVNEAFDCSNSSALMEACAGGDPLIPHYLIDNGADVNEGGFPGCGPLYAAVSQKQPLDLVEKMVESGAEITGSTLLVAFRRQDPAILEFLLNRASGRNQSEYLGWAQKTNNPEIVAIAEQREKNLGKKDTGNKNSIMTEKGGLEGKRWWQFCRGT